MVRQIISPFGSMMHFIAKTGGVDELPGYGKNAVPSGRRLEICTVFYNMQVTTCSGYYI